MAKLYVKNECVDQRDGKRYFPGDTFPGPTSADDGEVDRLTRANCLTETKPEGSESSQASATSEGRAPPQDVTGIRNVMQLRAIAKREQIELGEAKSLPEIQAAIAEGRKARAG